MTHPSIGEPASAVTVDVAQNPHVQLILNAAGKLDDAIKDFLYSRYQDELADEKLQHRSRMVRQALATLLSEARNAR